MEASQPQGQGRHSGRMCAGVPPCVAPPRPTYGKARTSERAGPGFPGGGVTACDNSFGFARRAELVASRSVRYAPRCVLRFRNLKERPEALVHPRASLICAAHRTVRVVAVCETEALGPQGPVALLVPAVCRDLQLLEGADPCESRRCFAGREPGLVDTRISGRAGVEAHERRPGRPRMRGGGGLGTCWPVGGHHGPDRARTPPPPS
jgi:hypothetical protein